eukprot:TRINITY_DN2495_c0_g1_i11.p1 TRINITY_DN2495_c0_g1~~TRINITY_DN2495_c0_g1_i11.p1  ORF type:complete len:808 (+),score=89.13 TRINITY_DN2495_c0_g1_i11:2-2425(+)
MERRHAMAGARVAATLLLAACAWCRHLKPDSRYSSRLAPTCGEEHDCGDWNWRAAFCCTDCDVAGGYVEAAELFYPPQVPYKYTQVCISAMLGATEVATKNISIALYRDNGGIPADTPFSKASAMVTFVAAQPHAWYTIDVSTSNLIAWERKVWLSVLLNTCDDPYCLYIGFNMPTWDCPSYDTAYRDYSPVWILPRSQEQYFEKYAAFSIRAEGVTVRGITPPDWTCDPVFYKDGGICDCNCTIYDPDCLDKSLPVYGCSASSGFVCSSRTGCTAIPARCTNWTYFDSLNGCQCGTDCGLYDVDCNFVWSQPVEGCPAGGDWYCQQNDTCGVVDWTCPLSQYNDGLECNCGCGNGDPDCKNASLPISGCQSGYVCNSVGACIIDGWTCIAGFYGASDGCDCNCGVVDADCSAASAPVYNCLNSTKTCSANGTCVAPNLCGNWRVENAESCDSGLGCTSNCSCGRGYKSVAAGTLAVDCVPICGDAIVVSPEECDGGFGCLSCKCNSLSSYDPPQPACGPACRNGVLDPGEECDSGEGCDDRCKCKRNWEKYSPGQLQCKQIPNKLAVTLGVILPCLGVLCLLLAAAAVTITVVKTTRKHRAQIRNEEEKAKVLLSEVQKHEKAITIDPNDLELQERIGAGSFGTVYKALWRGTQVAVKKINSHMVVGDQLLQFQQEIEVAKTLRHPNCLLFMGYARTAEHLFIVTEYMPQGSLADVLANGAFYLSYDMMVNIAHDIALGMNFLHTNDPPILHRDLKSANLLLASNFSCKIADFGLTVFSGTVKNELLGSLLWTAPEGNPYSSNAVR